MTVAMAARFPGCRASSAALQASAFRRRAVKHRPFEHRPFEQRPFERRLFELDRAPRRLRGAGNDADLGRPMRRMPCRPEKRTARLLHQGASALSTRASPDNRFGLATGGAFRGRALITTLAREFVRSLARLVKRRQLESFDDTIVANRHGGQPGDQCFDSIHIRAHSPRPGIDANRDWARTPRTGDRSTARTMTMRLP
jgi:hypothetical protein